MSELNIKITEIETGETKNIDTVGYLLIYMDGNDKIKMDGRMGLKVLAPILTKIALEKLTR